MRYKLARVTRFTALPSGVALGVGLALWLGNGYLWGVWVAVGGALLALPLLLAETWLLYRTYRPPREGK